MNLHEDRYRSMPISRSSLLRVKTFSDKIYKENNNTHFMLNSLFPETRAIYETWKKKKIVESVRLQMATRYGSCTLHVA